MGFIAIAVVGIHLVITLRTRGNAKTKTATIRRWCLVG